MSKYRLTFSNDPATNGETTEFPPSLAGCLERLGEMLAVAVDRRAPTTITLVVTPAGAEVPMVGDPVEALTAGQARDVVAGVREALWPEGDSDHPWSPDTLDEVAELLARFGLGPRPSPGTEG
jgi:hypothetical protein